MSSTFFVIRQSCKVKTTEVTGEAVLPCSDLQITTRNMGTYLLRGEGSNGFHALVQFTKLLRSPMILNLAMCQYKSDDTTQNFKAVVELQQLNPNVNTERINVLLLGLAGSGKTSILSMIKYVAQMQVTLIMLIFRAQDWNALRTTGSDVLHDRSLSI